MTRKLLLAAALLAVIGVGLIGYALTLPLYTDPHAPARLSQSLKPGQIVEWYTQLETYETPHKSLFNWGLGLLSLSVGIAASISLIRLFLQHPKFRNIESFFIAWTILWLIRFPATIFFYWLRQSWFEYPTWSDGIGIAILREFSAWIVGALVTSAFLIAFVLGRRLPQTLTWIRPTRFLEWVRIGVLEIWMLLLVIIVLGSIPDGDVGGIVSGTLATATLLLLIAAPPKVPNSGKG
jgi:hypothetical protein